ncbi:hypothetical protein HUJ05_002172 [Dendroctonus ponderosae]|nr:hypothetical protein HUJ05_002172 [Dendroctonus ponderosae]
MNLQLPGDDLNLIKPKNVVVAFVAKLLLHKKNIGRQSCNNDDLLVYSQHLENLHSGFIERFQNILKLEIPDWVLDPFSNVNIEISPQLGEELIELTTNEEIKIKYKNDNTKAFVEIQLKQTQSLSKNSDGQIRNDTHRKLVKEAMLEAADSLFEEFKNKKEIASAINTLQLLARTVTGRIEVIADNLKAELSNDMENLLPLKGSTRGGDLFSTFNKYIIDVKLPRQKLSSITTDGTPAMTEDEDVQFTDLLYTEMRWLSRGKILERFIMLLPQIKKFIASRGEFYEQLENKDWLIDLGFLTYNGNLKNTREKSAYC